MNRSSAGSEGGNTGQVLALRSRIILERATGASQSNVARRIEVSIPTVRTSTWWGHFFDHGLDGLLD